jgi:methylenetetrahydrofolate dehydrogenase (NADP+)/methenyltetrahydrofolate cyclohydrolase
MALILSGRDAATAWKSHIRKEVAGRRAQGKRAPHLAAILVGEDPASQAYVKGKVRDCEEVGFESTLIALPANATQHELQKHVSDLNSNSAIDGFIVQLPLPSHLNADEVLLSDAWPLGCLPTYRRHPTECYCSLSTTAYRQKASTPW